MKVKLILSRRSLAGAVVRAVAIGSMVAAFVAGPLTVVPAFADTTTGAGQPINASYAIPYPPSTTFNCQNVAPSTFTATLALAAPASQRLALFAINMTTQTMGLALNSGNTGSRPPDVYLLPSASFGSAGTIGAGPAISNLPVLPAFAKLNGRLQALNGDSNASSRIDMSGGFTPQGAIYAVSESTGATTALLTRLSICELVAQ